MTDLELIETWIKSDPGLMSISRQVTITQSLAKLLTVTFRWKNKDNRECGCAGRGSKLTRAMKLACEHLRENFPELDGND